MLQRIARLLATHTMHLHLLLKIIRIREASAEQNIPTAAVSSDGIVFVNLAFLDTLTDDEVIGLLYHEAQHLVLLRQMARA